MNTRKLIFSKYSGSHKTGDFQEDRKEYPLTTLDELRRMLKQHDVKLGKGVKLHTVWGRKWEEYIGKAPDGYTVTLDNGKW